jgi:hypothetical protein
VEVPEVIICDCKLKFRRMVTCCLPLLDDKKILLEMGGSVIAPDNSYWCFNFPLELVMLLCLSDMHVPYVRV